MDANGKPSTVDRQALTINSCAHYAFHGTLDAMTENEVGARIAWLYTEMGLKPAQFARYLGKQPHQISTWVKRGSIDTKNATLVAKKTGATIDWILLGQGELPTPPKINVDSLVDGQNESRVEVDILTSLLTFLPVSDATPSEIASLHEAAKAAVAHSGIPNWPEELRRLRVRGDKRSADGTKIETEIPEGLARRTRR